eukprot:JP446775.1.p2 GENE.JP446775.1~~JP446775.1.p2  ORF type:complete len:133 (+),score=11.94 JP446775.1:348-746(+)
MLFPSELVPNAVRSLSDIQALPWTYLDQPTPTEAVQNCDDLTEDSDPSHVLWCSIQGLDPEYVEQVAGTITPDMVNQYSGHLKSLSGWGQLITSLEFSEVDKPKTEHVDDEAMGVVDVQLFSQTLHQKACVS